jgi:hypothetical protein
VTIIGEEKTLDLLLEGKSIARFGDGELNNCEGKKCVPQLMVPGLAEELREIMTSKNDACLVGIPYVDARMPPEKQASWKHYLPRFEPFKRTKKQYYSAFITRPDSAPWIATKEYFDKVNSLWKDKEVTLVWGGYRSLYPDFLRKTGAAKAHSVIVSYEDAYAQIDDIEQRVLATGSKTVLLCAGPTATCLAHRLSLRGVQAIDLGHIGLFWRHADAAHKDISIAPVTVLPKVEVTKAQIKTHGAVDISPRVEGLWWPRCDMTPEITLKRQHAQAAALRQRILSACRDWNGTAVLVGAGAGPIAFETARHFKRVFAFEPDFGMFGALRRNIHMHNWRNIAFYKECVGDKVGTTRMRPGVEAGDWCVDIEGSASVMQTTIDAMELDECSAIIINGACGERLMYGAQETCRKFLPKVIAL